MQHSCISVSSNYAKHPALLPDFTCAADPAFLQFCKDIEPGNARTKECLEENREELSSACKEEVDSMIERRVRDFRLDSKLRQACETEIFNMCAYFGVSATQLRQVAECGRLQQQCRAYEAHSLSQQTLTDQLLSGRHKRAARRCRHCTTC